MICATVACVLVHVSLSPRIDGDTQLFLQLLRSTLPQTGAFEARFENPNGVRARMITAFDAESRAFYRIGNGLVFGRSRAGKYYRADETTGQVRVWPESEYPSHEILESSFPGIILYELLDHPECILDVQHRQEGFIVTFQFPGGSYRFRDRSLPSYALTDPPPMHAEIDSQGRVIKRDWGLSTSKAYDYPHANDPAFPLPDVNHEGMALLDAITVLSPDDRPMISAMFEPSAAVKRAQTLQTDPRSAGSYSRPWTASTISLSPGKAATAMPPSSPTTSRRQAIPEANSPADLRWPLVLVGIVTAAIGVIAWKRR